MSNDRNMYDDDFLETLMSEVRDVNDSSSNNNDGESALNTDETLVGSDERLPNNTGGLSGLVGESSEPTSHSRVSNDSGSEKTQSILSRPRRQGGLLSQLGGVDDESKSEVSDDNQQLDDILPDDSRDSRDNESIDEEEKAHDKSANKNKYVDKSKNTSSVGISGGSLLGKLNEDSFSDSDKKDLSSVNFKAEVVPEERKDNSDDFKGSDFHSKKDVVIANDSDYDSEKELEEQMMGDTSVNYGDERDSLDSMLDDLADDNEDVDEMARRAELDSNVEVPLEKPGMDEIIVTPDGKSLADMLPGMRGGSRRTAEVVSEIRDQERVVDVQGNKFSDSRYTKHVENTNKEQAVDEERIALSMKFLQRNAKFSEQEKVIMRNLGLTNEQLAKVMSSQELNMKEKKEILALGRYGSEKHFKGRRYRTTVGDTAMLEFLTKFKFANTRILRWISNEPQGRTWRKLNRLRNSGLAESKSLIGVPDLWAATPSGVAISGYAYEPGLRPMPKMMSISSNMGVNYLAACLWFNSVNVLNLEDFPAHNRVIALQDDGRDRVQGEMLVSEYELRSSLGKEINPQSTTMRTLGDQRLYDVISSNVRSEIDAWEAGGKLGDSPEFLLGNEYMWVLFPTSQLTLSYHVPDLVVKRERGPNGEPRSIAVEMERFEKSNDRYDKIMLAYKLDEHLYESVIWVTPSTRVARALERAANAVGFDRYSIIPIITESGVYSKQDIWMI